MYFSSREIRELLRSVYRDLYKYPIVKNIRKNNKDTKDVYLINNEFKRELSLTRFLAVGNPSESGAHLLYYFRQENVLPKKLFISAHEVFHMEDNDTIVLAEPEIKRYVFLDDFCGGGTQATGYLENLVSKIKSKNPESEVLYFVLFANKDGLSYVKRNTAIDLGDAVFKLDDTYKCFGRNSRHEPDKDMGLDWGFAKKVSIKYGKTLYKDHPLGHGDCQFLIGFFHNTPNNTLPIIWAENDKIHWKPIFRRYPKVYGGVK